MMIISPIGSDGTNQTFLLATLRYRAKDLTANAASNLACTTTFPNRNGGVVLALIYVPAAPLSVIAGYTVNGTVPY